MASTSFISAWPLRPDNLNLQAEAGVLPDGIRKWPRWHNILEKRVAKLQAVLGTGSPAATLRTTVSQARALASNGIRRARETLYVDTTSVAMTGTTETDLMRFVVPAGSLDRIGDRLEIRAALESATLGGAADRTVRFYVGGSSMTVASIAATAIGIDLLATISLVKASETTLVAVATVLSDASDALANPVGNVTRAAFTISATEALGIKFTGDSDDPAATITQQHMSVTLVPV